MFWIGFKNHVTRVKLAHDTNHFRNLAIDIKQTYICNMKKIVVILLSTLLLAVSIRDMFTIMSFELNQEFLTEKYCINLNNADLMCNGVCYLGNILEEHNKEKDVLPALHLGDQVLFVAQQSQQLDVEKIPGDRHVIQRRDQIGHGQLFLSEIFQPPRYS